MNSTQHLLFVLLCVFIFNFTSSIFHELGHAYTVKSFNNDLHRAGFIFTWIGLKAYVDTSDMWLNTRDARIKVNFAGPFTDMLIAAIVSILAWLMPQNEIALFFWLFALLLYVDVFRNLNPLHYNDGYTILQDALNCSNLREISLRALVDSKYRMHRSTRKYWIVCGVFLTTALLFSIVFQHYLRLLLPNTILGISTFHLIWLLPAIVIIYFVTDILVSLQKIKR